MSEKQELKNQELGEVSGGFSITRENGMIFIAPGHAGELGSYQCPNRNQSKRIDCEAVLNDGRLVWRLRYLADNGNYHEEFLDRINLSPQEEFSGAYRYGTSPDGRDLRTVICLAPGQVRVL